MIELWKHQQDAVRFAVYREASYLAMAMGTGKTLVALTLLKHWEARNVLVLCPTSVLGVWRREAARWTPWYQVVAPTRPPVAMKAREIAESRSDGFRIVVVNYESAWRKPLDALLLKDKWDAVILDEAHRIKGHNTKVSKFCAMLAEQAKRRLCLSGTPMTQGPLDLFGQFRFLNPTIFGTSWYRFLNRYAIRDNPMIPQMVTKYQNMAELKAKFHANAFQVGSEVLTLPPALTIDIPIDLSGKAAYVYGQMEREFVAEVAGGVVTAANTLVKTLRLRQICSGYLAVQEVETLDGEPDELLVTVHEGKRDALTDLLSGLDEPVVVFAEFLNDLDTVSEVCEQLGLRYGELSGRRKDGLDANAQMSGDIDVLGTQYQSGSLGVDLTRSAAVIYYSPTFSLSGYEQSVARLVRPGQTRPVRMWRLIIKDTIDEKVWGALDRKRDVIDEVLSSYTKGVANESDRPPNEVREAARRNPGGGEEAQRPEGRKVESREFSGRDDAIHWSELDAD